MFFPISFKSRGCPECSLVPAVPFGHEAGRKLHPCSAPSHSISTSESPTGFLPQHHSPSGTLCFFPGSLLASCLAFQDSCQVSCSPSHPRQQNKLKTHSVTGGPLPGARQTFPDYHHQRQPVSTFPSPSAPQNFCNWDYVLNSSYQTHVFQVWVYILCFHSLSSQRYSKMFASLHLLVQPHSLHRPDSSCVVALISMPVPTR